MTAARTSALALAASLAAFACSGDSGSDLALQTGELPDGRLGENYDAKLEATGGVAPYTFAITAGELPDGLMFKADTGQISGVAGEAGKHQLTFSVTDAEKNTAMRTLELFVIPDPLTIVTTRLNMGREGDAYSESLLASGGLEPYKWSLSSGTLPGGVTVEEAGSITGTPSENGRFSIGVMVEDSLGTQRTQDVDLVVISRAPMVSTSTVPKGRVGAPYDTTIRATGGTPPYSFDLGGGALPMGLGINNEGGITGTPEESGDFVFTVRVEDSEFEVAMLEITMTVIPALEITSTAIPQIVSGRALDFTFEAAGGEPPYTWTIEGDLPMGVTFDSATGRLAGMSTDLGEYPLTARVQDSEGFRRSALFNLRVSDRFIFEVVPGHAFPPICTGTTASFTAIDIPVTESFAIEDIDVTVDIAFTGSNRNTRITLISPSGHPVVLCGDGVYRGRGNPGRVPGGIFCGGSNGFQKTFDDEGAQDDRPELPLSRLNGENVVGTWKLDVGVSNPNCNNTGSINRVVLSVRDDRSAEDYTIVSGWTPNNRLGYPWLRITGTAVGEDELFLSATRYSVGPNGIREGGKGDDVALPDVITWSWGDWDGRRGPNDHNVTPDGHVTSGVIAGGGTLIMSGPGGFRQEIPIGVSPPSWHRRSRLY